MGYTIKRLLPLFLFLFVFSYSVEGQVTIAPTHVFMDGQTNFASFLVMNGTDNAQEVSVSFQFGYPASDSAGNTQMIYNDSMRAKQFSVADDIRGFPQSFVLQPDQRQTIRLRMTNPQDYSDGTYWSRITTTSNPQSPPIEASADEDAVTAQVNFKFEQVTTVFYQKGNLTTGLNVKDIYTRQSNQDSVVQVFTDVKRTGNSPFLGSIGVTVKGPDGKKVYERMHSTTVYFDVLKRMDIPFDQLENGKQYTAEIRFLPERSDISDEELVKTEPVSKSTTFTFE